MFYEFDTLQGPAVSYYDNGLLLSEGEMLDGNRTGIWSVTVRGNWRVTFRFEDGDVELVNYEDYH